MWLWLITWRVFFRSSGEAFLADMFLTFEDHFCPITWRKLFGARSWPSLAVLPEKVPTKKAKYQ